MDARDSLKEGDVSAALSTLEGQIRKDPSNVQLRTFLFQLTAVKGEWNRSLTQLNVISDMDPNSMPMVNTYKEVLQCEGLRTTVFAGKRSPLIFGDPEKWLALLLEALRLTGNEKFDEAEEMRSKAFSEAPTASGTINGTPFEWLADADTRLGPVFEVIMKGRYYWVPLSRIKRVALEEPVDLRDLIWLPAHFTWHTGEQEVGFIPSRYPGSHENDDPLICLSRKTEWAKKTETLFIGEGQRVLNTDTAEYPLLEARTIEFTA